MDMPYVSCIKLRGVPILPPVVDAVCRKEMQQYRDQAICIEKQLLYSKRVSMDSGLGTATNCDLAVGRDATLSPQNNFVAVVDTTLNVTYCSCSSGESDCDDEVLVKEAQHNELTIPCSSNAEFSSNSCIPTSDQLDVDQHTDDCDTKSASHTSQASETTLTPQSHSPGRKNDNVTQLDETVSSVAMSGSTDLNHYVDMSLTSSATSLLAGEHQDNVLPVSELLPLCVSNLKLQHKSLISGNDCNLILEKSKLPKNDTEQCDETAVSTFSSETVRPRLMRSNSYTLEAPSPVLLAHVEQTKRNCLSRDSLLPCRRSWTLPPDKVTMNNFVFAIPQPAKNTPACKKNIAAGNKLSSSLPSSTSSSPLKTKPSHASTDCVSQKSFPPSKLKKRSDASICTATTPECRSNCSSESFDVSSDVSHSDETCTAGGSKDIRQLFVELQSKYEQEKAKLLARQRQEQDEMEMMFRNKCEQLVAVITNQCPELLSATQASPTSLSPAGTQLQVVKTGNLSRTSSSSRQLFPYSAAEHKAASIIEAAVRGYIVRRLMKTEKVQNLKATILDTVKCALRLEQDCQDKVTPADVEFHRGLITQLNAAILEFHHLFFSTSVRERMDVIATDRLRLSKQQARISSQHQVSSATKKYLKRKSHDGLSMNSSWSSSSPSCVRRCQSARSANSSGKSRSSASTPVTRREPERENRGHQQRKRSNSSSHIRKPWR